jgi:hypothetical protein
LSIYSFALLSDQSIPKNSFNKSLLNENNNLFSNDEKIKCDATINHDFADDSVIVIMSAEVTFKFEEYSNNYFENANIGDLRKLTNETSKIVEDQLLSEDKSDSSMSLSNAADVSIIKEENFRDILSLKLKNPSKENVLETIKSLETRSDVIYAGPNYIHESAATTPNDPYYINGSQWAINHIGLPSIWDLYKGSNTVKVGIIDTGIDGTHSDLDDRTNNNLHKDFRGAVTTNVSTPTDTDSHGTHVAGIIGAETNNSLGVAGTNWNVSLISLLISESGSWYSDNAILAVDYATSNNISILNYSGRVRNRQNVINYNDPAFELAISNFPGLFVAAAGNTNRTGNNNDLSPQYPANYSLTLDNVISVGAINSSNQRANFSHYGENSVNIYAPGVDIYSTVPGNSYASYDGTSMAAPFVSGVAALMKSKNPTLTGSQMRLLLQDSANTISISTPHGNQSVKSLNAYNAITSTPTPHYHSFTNPPYVWMSLTRHTSHCDCGARSLQGHAVSSSWNGIGTTTCLICGGRASMGFVQFGIMPRGSLGIIFGNNLSYFGNGSYVLPNGLVVLVDEDIEAYINGTLCITECKTHTH